jgi:LysR family glycine cleavage system transcriptional activator
MNYRRLTPSMSLLLAFEAAARHESYTRAAEDLSLSQSAISRQVQTLEEQLGILLFRREGRTVRLTEAGRRYAAEMNIALGRVRAATLQAMAHRVSGGALRLAILPTFGSKWLLPRLHDFYARHPGVTVHVHTRIGEIDFDTEELDAAVTVGTGNWPTLIAHSLQNEFLVGIASPDAKHGRKPLAPHWIPSQTLLSVASNQNAWADWFSHYGLDHRLMKVGPTFELTSHLVQAVRAGMGVGLVPATLVEEEINRSELVEIGLPIESQRSYFLVYPARNESLPSLVAFRSWLADFALKA